MPESIPLSTSHTVSRNEMQALDRLEVDPADWRDACLWLQANTPVDALILGPRGTSTLRWHAAREVANNKDFPQDAASIVAWWQTLRRLHEKDARPDALERWWQTMAVHGYAGTMMLARSTPADYVMVQYVSGLARFTERPLYENRTFAVYRVERGE